MILEGDAAQSPLETDICIIGAGAAGISIALQFLTGPHHVILIDSGGERPDAASQSLCRGEVAEPARHSPANTFRRRGLGGSTTIWGGRSAPFDALDFAPRPWLSLPGWPIGAAHLAPYYPAAAEICELGAPDFAADSAVPGGMRPMFPGLVSTDISTERIERFSPPTDFGRRYRRDLARAPRLLVLLHAHCLGLALSPGGSAVGAIEIVTRSGSRRQIRARIFVLAAGGLEIPRLLLTSRTETRNGIGNGRDQVGRHYMCHLAGVLGRFQATPGRPPWTGYQRTPDGVYCRRRLSVEPEAQARAGIGTAIARLHHPPIHDAAHRRGPLSAIYLARRTLPYEYASRLEGHRSPAFPHLRNIAAEPFATAAFAGHWLTSRALVRRKFPSVVIPARTGAYTLDIHAEQLPNPLSRITLADAADAHGVPQLRIDWRHSAADIHTVTGTLGLIADALRHGGHGLLCFDSDQVEAEILRDGAYGGHHIGTARMSDSPRDGVVDRDCRVHGVENLYVAGSAVFPTSSQANPTLTLVALALRLADHLKRCSAHAAPAMHHNSPPRQQQAFPRAAAGVN